MRQDEIDSWSHTSSGDMTTGPETGDNLATGPAGDRVRVAVLYGQQRPSDLPLLHGDTSVAAEIIELSVADDVVSRLRAMAPDLAVFYPSAQLPYADVKALIGLLRGGILRVVVVVDGEGLNEVDLPGVVVCDRDMDAGAVRRVIRRHITLIGDIKYKSARINAWANNIATLSRDIVTTYSDLLHPGRSDLCHCHSVAEGFASHPTGIVGFSLAMVRSMTAALGEKFGNIEYLQILLFVHEATVVRQDEVLISALGRLIDAPYSTTVRRIDELTREGYLSKSVDTIDKRRINVAITDRGAEAVEAFLDRTSTSIATLLQSPGPRPQL